MGSLLPITTSLFEVLPELAFAWLPSPSESVCIPIWAGAVNLTIICGLLVRLWILNARVGNVFAKLQQSSDDASTLSDLFSSELERVRQQLSQSREDNDSLDEILGSILKGGLPGHLEMMSDDYWCVRTMDVAYTDQDGEKQHWRQSGYNVNCFVPGGARDIEVIFDVVGGAPCHQVDRGNPDLPWVYDKEGRKQIDEFHYERCPQNVRYKIRGPSLGAFVSHVTEVPPSSSSIHQPKAPIRK